MRRPVVQMLFLAGLLCFGQPVFGGTLYSNLGSGSDVYDRNIDAPVYGSASAAGFYETWAFPFTPVASGAVAQLDIPLVHLAGTDSVIVELLADASGTPGTVLESWTVTDLADVRTCCTLKTLSGTASLTAGAPYWITVLPGANDTFAYWPLNSTSTVGPLYVDFGSWGYLSDTYNTLGAFEIRDTQAAPEPASFALVAGALAIVAGLRRRYAPAGRRRTLF